MRRKSRTRDREAKSFPTNDHTAEPQDFAQLDPQLRAVLDAVPGGALLLDLDGRIIYLNRTFAQLFSLDFRQAREAGTIENLESQLNDRIRDAKTLSFRWRAGRDGELKPSTDELELLKPTRRVIERTSRPVLDREGRATGWIESYQDITSRRQFQSKLVQTEKMAALGQLVSGIAHELNNPLTSIMGYAQLLLGRGLAPGQLNETMQIFREAERARRIVKNLLLFARENQPERSRADLNEIVERALALRSYELKIENILVELALASDLPATMADPYQLQQIVLNLLVNAEQALLESRGSGEVRIRTFRSPHARVALEIADNGPGIPAEIASRIFDPFFSTKPPGVGTGLGLSIVYGIVHQHGGEVYFENLPGGGARFVVEFPIVAVAAEPAKENLAQSMPAPGASRGRILVVEDEPTVARLIADVLGEEGHHVEAVLDSQEGLARVARNRYDAVICDVRMPRLDGQAFYQALVRAGSPLRDRILFVTGDTLAPRTREFLESHNVPHLDKPFLVEELKIAVNRLLDQNSASHAAAFLDPSGAATWNQPEVHHKQ
ncbi:MAG TPA: ATP-binding protein [Candidatus Acidoferrales bacterium]|nr:ATP-binding protein [Candidatus Acidoferrales bacterium]